MKEVEEKARASQTARQKAEIKKLRDASKTPTGRKRTAVEAIAVIAEAEQDTAIPRGRNAKSRASTVAKQLSLDDDNDVEVLSSDEEPVANKGKKPSRVASIEPNGKSKAGSKKSKQKAPLLDRIIRMVTLGLCAALAFFVLVQVTKLISPQVEQNLVSLITAPAAKLLGAPAAGQVATLSNSGNVQALVATASQYTVLLPAQALKGLLELTVGTIPTIYARVLETGFVAGVLAAILME